MQKVYSIQGIPGKHEACILSMKPFLLRLRCQIGCATICFAAERHEYIFYVYDFVINLRFFPKPSLKLDVAHPVIPNNIIIEETSRSFQKWEMEIWDWNYLCCVEDDVNIAIYGSNLHVLVNIYDDKHKGGWDLCDTNCSVLCYWCQRRSEDQTEGKSNALV